MFQKLLDFLEIASRSKRLFLCHGRREDKVLRGESSALVTALPSLWHQCAPMFPLKIFCAPNNWKCLWWYNNGFQYYKVDIISLHTQTCIKCDVYSDKTPHYRKTILRQSIPSTMVNSMGFRFRDMDLKSYCLLLEVWLWTGYNSSLDTECENGIRMHPAQAALKNQFRWCP